MPSFVHHVFPSIIFLQVSGCHVLHHVVSPIMLVQMSGDFLLHCVAPIMSLQMSGSSFLYCVLPNPANLRLPSKRQRSLPPGPSPLREHEAEGCQHKDTEHGGDSEEESFGEQESKVAGSSWNEVPAAWESQLQDATDLAVLSSYLSYPLTLACAIKVCSNACAFWWKCGEHMKVARRKSLERTRKQGGRKKLERGSGCLGIPAQGCDGVKFGGGEQLLVPPPYFGACLQGMLPCIHILVEVWG